MGRLDMVKFGIWRPEQLKRAASDGNVPADSLIAITLYPKIAGMSGPHRDQLLDGILLSFATANGTFKRTYAARFQVFDADVVKFIHDWPWPRRLLDVHDAATSDGRTAVDFFTELRRAALAINFLATDATPDVAVVSDPAKSKVMLVLDPTSSTVLQIISPPFVFNVRKPVRRMIVHPINRLIQSIVYLWRGRPLLARLRNGDRHLSLTHVRLLSPSCLNLLGTEPQFQFEHYDLLQPIERRFDVVRAMNILNAGYFSESTLRRMIQNIHASLRAGGLFVAGSNEAPGSRVDGSIYERQEGGFRRVWDSGLGSRIDALILGFHISVKQAAE
jgi:CheR methyltransferase, SAM binding domain